MPFSIGTISAWDIGISYSVILALLDLYGRLTAPVNAVIFNRRDFIISICQNQWPPGLNGAYLVNDISLLLCPSLPFLYIYIYIYTLFISATNLLRCLIINTLSSTLFTCQQWLLFGFLSGSLCIHSCFLLVFCYRFRCSSKWKKTSLTLDFLTWWPLSHALIYLIGPAAGYSIKELDF